MKKFIILLAVFFGSMATISAQDIITLKNGDEIKAKVQEVGLSDVKYKKFENLTGPIYTLLKTEIFMIKYENGEKDIFKDDAVPAPAAPSISSPEKPQEEMHLTSSFWAGTVFRNANGEELSKEMVRSILADTPTALKEYNEGRRMHTWGYVYSGIGGGLLGIGLCGIVGLADFGDEASLAVGGVGLVFCTLGLVMDAVGNSNWKKAYKIYQNAQTKTTASLNFGPTHSGGIGLTLTF